MAGLLSHSCGKETVSPACWLSLAQSVHVWVMGAREQIAGQVLGVHWSCLGLLVTGGPVGVAPSPLVAIACCLPVNGGWSLRDTFASRSWSHRENGVRLALRAQGGSVPDGGTGFGEGSGLGLAADPA